MLFLAVLVNALHAALEDREIAFDGVGVGFTSDVFLAEFDFRYNRRFGIGILGGVIALDDFKTFFRLGFSSWITRSITGRTLTV